MLLPKPREFAILKPLLVKCEQEPTRARMDGLMDRSPASRRNIYTLRNVYRNLYEIEEKAGEESETCEQQNCWRDDSKRLS